MVKGKCKNLTNRNKDYLVSSEPSTLTSASPGYPNTLKKQDSDLKFHLMIDSLKETQENTGKQVESLKEETQKSLKEL